MPQVPIRYRPELVAALDKNRIIKRIYQRRHQRREMTPAMNIQARRCPSIAASANLENSQTKLMWRTTRNHMQIKHLRSNARLEMLTRIVDQRTQSGGALGHIGLRDEARADAKHARRGFEYFDRIRFRDAANGYER